MIIREAATNDIPVLLDLEQQVVEFERQYNPSIRSKDVYYYDLSQLIESNESQLLVGEKDGQIIATGYASIRESKASVEHTIHSYIGFMYVAPEHRGKGISQQIMDCLIKWSQTQGISYIYLDVYAENAGAVRAYQKAGFKPCMMEMKLGL